MAIVKKQLGSLAPHVPVMLYWNVFYSEPIYKANQELMRHPELCAHTPDGKLYLPGLSPPTDCCCSPFQRV